MPQCSQRRTDKQKEALRLEFCKTKVDMFWLKPDNVLHCTYGFVRLIHQIRIYGNEKCLEQ